MNGNYLGIALVAIVACGILMLAWPHIGKRSPWAWFAMCIAAVIVNTAIIWTLTRTEHKGTLQPTTLEIQYLARETTSDRFCLTGPNTELTAAKVTLPMRALPKGSQIVFTRDRTVQSQPDWIVDTSGTTVPVWLSRDSSSQETSINVPLGEWISAKTIQKHKIEVKWTPDNPEDNLQRSISFRFTCDSKDISVFFQSQVGEIATDEVCLVTSAESLSKSKEGWQGSLKLSRAIPVFNLLERTLHCYLEKPGLQETVNRFPNDSNILEFIKQCYIIRKNPESPDLSYGLIIPHNQKVQTSYDGVDTRSTIQTTFESHASSKSIIGIGSRPDRALDRIVLPQDGDSNIKFDAHRSFRLPEDKEIAKSFLLLSRTSLAPVSALTLNDDTNLNLSGLALSYDRLNGQVFQRVGKAETLLETDKPFVLGSPSDGFLVQLHDRRIDLSKMAFLGLFVPFAWLVLTFITLKRVQPQVDSARYWTTISLAFLTLWTIKFCLSYRCALFPPLGSFKEAASFRSSMGIATISAIGPLAVAILPTAGSIFKTVKSVQIGRTVRILPVMVITFLLVILGLFHIISSNLAIALIQISLFLGLWLNLSDLSSHQVAATTNIASNSSKRFNLEHYNSANALSLISLWGICCLGVLVIVDAGSFYFAFPFSVLSLFFVQYIRKASQQLKGHKEREQRFSTFVAITAPIALFCALTFVVFYKPVALSLTSTLDDKAAGYRLAVFHNLNAEFMQGRDQHNYEGTPTREQLLYRNIDQKWQSQIYATSYKSEAGVGYSGFGQLPLANTGMTYGTMLSDEVFPTFVLGEHGLLAGLALVSVYVLLFFGALFAAKRLSHRSDPMLLVIVGIAFHLVFASLYMCMASTWILPFTGQNMPFLSLNSPVDSIHISVLVIILCSAVLRSDRLLPTSVTLNENRRPFKVAGVMAVISFCFACLMIATIRVPDSQANTGDLAVDQIKDAAIKALKEAPPAQKFGPYLAELPNQPLSIRSAISQYNHSLDKSGTDKVLNLEIDDSSVSVTVDPFRNILRSPFLTDFGHLEMGQIYARGNHSSAQLEMKFGTYILRRGTLNEVVIQPIKGAPVEMPISLTYQDEHFVLTPATGVKLNGAAIDSPIRLRNGDFVSLNEMNGIFSTLQPPSVHSVRPGFTCVSFPTWRNGRLLRLPRLDFESRLITAIGHATDASIESSATASKVNKTADLFLSLDIDLDRSLRSALVKSAQTQYKLASSQIDDRLPKNYISATILRPGSGHILAMIGVPTVEEGVNSYQTSGSVSDWNLNNHVIGSLVKPLTLSSLAFGFREGLNIGKSKSDVLDLVIKDEVQIHKQLGDLSLKRGKDRFWALQNPIGDTTMSRYLTRSRTWPAIVTGMLGIVESPEDLSELAVPDSSHPEFLINGSGFTFNFSSWAKSPNSSLDSNLNLVPAKATNSVLFKSMRSLFNIETDMDTSDSWKTRYKKQFGKFMPLTAKRNERASLLPPSTLLPELITYRGSNLGGRPANVLLNSLIGGGETRFNNVWLAQSYARIFTGSRVFASLEDEVPPKFEEMPAPISNVRWRDRAILQPLSLESHKKDFGTLRSLIAIPGYKIVGKTGTLGEINGMQSEGIVFGLLYQTGDGFDLSKSFVGCLYLNNIRQSGGTSHRVQLLNTILKSLVQSQSTGR